MSSSLLRALAPARRAAAPRSVFTRKAYSTGGTAGPKKRHPIRNFFVGTTLLLTAGYAGAVYYSLENDDFYYYFTAYVPLASVVVNQVDDFRFKYLVNHRAQEDPTLEKQSRKPQEAVEFDGTKNKANASAFVPETHKAKVKEIKEDVKTVEPKSAKSDKEESKGAAAAPAAPAPAAPAVPAAADSVAPNNESHVVVVNSAKPERVSSSVSPGAAPSSVETQHLDPVLSEVSNAVNMCLRANGVDLKSDRYFSTLVSAVQGASRKIQQQRADLQRRYQDTIKDLKGDITKEQEKEYLSAKLKLVESYNNRLQAALDAVTQRSVAVANNKIQAQYVELLRKFNHEVNTKVETERDGRLGQLAELKKDIEVLQEATLKSGSVLESEDGIVAFFVDLANLQRVLSFSQSVPLKPYLDSLTRDLPSDPLVKSVVEAVPAIVKRYGVLSHAQLAARFQIIEPEIRRSSLVPPDAGVAAHLTSLAASQLLVSKQGFPEGNDVESVLARTNSYLQQGDVTSAVAEVNSLQGWPKKIAADWLDEGRKRSELEFLVNVLSDEGRLWSISRTK